MTFLLLRVTVKDKKFRDFFNGWALGMGLYYLGIDQGTTGTMAILFDKNWNEVSRGYQEIPLLYPQIGWVEHDPESVWESVLFATKP